MTRTSPWRMAITVLVLAAQAVEGFAVRDTIATGGQLRRVTTADLNGDGAISPREWTLARLAARREIARRHQALRSRPSRHFLGRPGDGRPFLISNHGPEGLGRRYAWLARLCLAMLLACLAKQSLGMDGAAAIEWVRQCIPGAVETDAQSQFVNAF